MQEPSGLTEFFFGTCRNQKATRNLQAGKFGQVDESIVGQDGHHIVTQVEPSQRP
jgi:hypothetical protein